jgi:hypothetical protein
VQEFGVGTLPLGAALGGAVKGFSGGFQDLKFQSTAFVHIDERELHFHGSGRNFFFVADHFLEMLDDSFVFIGISKILVDGDHPIFRVLEVFAQPEQCSGLAGGFAAIKDDQGTDQCPSVDFYEIDVQGVPGAMVCFVIFHNAGLY